VFQSESYEIIPAPAAEPPVISAPSQVQVVTGEKLQFKVSASDPNGDKVILSLVSSPSGGGVGFNASTGEFVWTPSVSQKGVHRLIFKASDGVLTSEKVVEVTVLGKRSASYHSNILLSAN
jgi:hypothetical protein